MKKTFKGMIIGTMAMALLAGCSSTKSTGGDENASKDVTLTLVGTKSEYDPAIKIYQKAYPNVKVNVIEGNWGPGGKDLRDKELVLLSSGQAPDIMKMVWGKEFYNKGVIEDLTDTIKSWDIYGKLTDGQKQRMTIDGHIFGLTQGNNTVMQYYNKDILAKIGAQPPKTIADLVDVAKKIKAANLQTADGKPVYATNFEGGNWLTDWWLFSSGVKQMNDDFTKTVIDSAEDIKVFQQMQDFVKNGWAPKIDNSGSQAFINGQIASYMTGTWEEKGMTDAKINWGVTTVPSGTSGAIGGVSIGGVEFGIAKQSKHKKEALDFLKVMSTKEFEETNGWAPTDPAMYDDSIKQKAYTDGGLALEGFKVQRDQLKNAFYNFLEAPFVFPDASTIYNSALQRILVKLDDPTAVMQDAAKQINQGIADANANK